MEEIGKASTQVSPIVSSKASKMVAAFLLVISSLLTYVAGNPLGRRAMQVHESRSEIPDGFAKTGTPSPDTVINFRIALAQTDPDGLTDALYDVSTPSSANYGNHLTKEEVRIHPTSSPSRELTSRYQGREIRDS